MTRFRPTWRRVRMLAVAALVPFLVSGCGGDGVTGPAADGTGNISATGAVSVSGTGVALQQSTAQNDIELFQVAIIPPTGTNANGWQLQIVSYDGRPLAGTHQLVELGEGTVTATLYHSSNGSMRMFNSTSGELTITSSSSSVVKGTFTFTAVDAQGPGTVQVQGSFSAKCPPGTSCI